jgi:hypothetical protein
VQARVEVFAVVQRTRQDRARPGLPRVIRSDDDPLALCRGDLELYERCEVVAVDVGKTAAEAQPASPPAVAEPYTDGVRSLF